MKKFSFAIILALLVGGAFTGCSGQKTVGGSPSQSSSESSAESSEESVTSEESDDGEELRQESEEESLTSSEPATEAPTKSEKPAEKLEPKENTYVYDNAGVLSSEAFKACDDYARKLYSDYVINAAVVTTRNLAGKSVYDFAADAYNTLYEGRGSGLLLVINEDSGNDYLYRSGSCAVFVDDDAVNSAFYWATKEIVAGDYQAAVMRLLQLGERCPDHVFDNGGLFSKEDITAFDSALSECSENVALLATSNGTDSTNEEIARNYLARRFEDGKGYMIMLDTESGSALVVSDKELSADIQKAVTEASKSASQEDYTAAANKLIEAFK